MKDSTRRVAHLIALYKEHYGRGRGRRQVHSADLLRASVVFLHAALEEMLRAFASYYLPRSNSTAIDRVPLLGHGESGRPTKFSLSALAAHRGKTVDSVLEESVRVFLARETFNSADDIVHILNDMGFAVDESVRRLLPDLQALMLRRHQIVHRADRLEDGARGQQRARSLSVRTLERWVKTVNAFGVVLLAYALDDAKKRGTEAAVRELRALQARRVTQEP